VTRPLTTNRARKLSPAIQRAVERRDRIEREFTQIERAFIQSADVLEQFGKQLGTSPQDTIFAIELNAEAGIVAAERKGYTGI